jgi:hypothetical protein
VRKGQTPSPRFFVNVASKGFRISVSGLESTLMGGRVSVAPKGVTLHQNCAKGGPDGVARRVSELNITTHAIINYLSCQV